MDTISVMQKTIQLRIDDLVFDCLAEGNPENELVLFLHGFPETSHMWKKLMSSISKNGFYCVAPNLRGYSKNACPRGKKYYRLHMLAKDVLNISNALNKSKFHLVGHDWGAAIGWKVVHDHPDLILSWSAISIPHLQAFGKAMVVDDQQRKMSQYIKNFQWPLLPERRIRKNDFRLFKRLWKNSDEDEIEEYLKVFGNPKQLTAALNYYRSNYKLLRQAAKEEILGNIQAPTLFVWGNKDLAIGTFAVDEGHQYMKDDYEFVELDAGHWLVQTNFQELEKAIGSHISKYRGRA